MTRQLSMTPGAIRARRYRKRLGPTRKPALARGCLQPEVNLAAFDDMGEALNRADAGRWPRRKRAPGQELTREETRDERDALAGALLDYIAKEIVTRDARIDALGVTLIANRQAPAAVGLAGGDTDKENIMASAKKAADETNGVVRPFPKSSPSRFLPQNCMQAADLRWTSWQARIPADHSWEDVQSPEYFRHRVNGLKPLDTIEVAHEGWKFWAKLLVRSVDTVSRQVSTYVLAYTDLSEAPRITLDWSKARIEERDGGPAGAQFIVTYGKQTIAVHASRAAAESWLAEQKANAV